MAEDLQECVRSGLYTFECSHCLEQESPDPCEGLTIFRSIEAKFNGICALDEEHKIKEEQNISLVGLAGTDSTKSIGWVCPKCATRINLLNTSPVSSSNLGAFA